MLSARVEEGAVLNDEERAVWAEGVRGHHDAVLAEDAACGFHRNLQSGKGQLGATPKGAGDSGRADGRPRRGACDEIRGIIGFSQVAEELLHCMGGGIPRARLHRNADQMRAPVEIAIRPPPQRRIELIVEQAENETCTQQRTDDDDHAVTEPSRADEGTTETRRQGDCCTNRHSAPFRRGRQRSSFALVRPVRCCDQRRHTHESQVMGRRK